MNTMCTDIHIFVINTPSASKRQKQAITQLEELGFPYTIFNAHTPERPHPKLTNIDNGYAFRHMGWPLTAGEIACYASHYALWEHCVKLNQPIIILEDDFKLNTNSKKHFFSIQSIITSLHFIRLTAPVKSELLPITKNNDITYFYQNRYHFGSTAYAISPIAAQRFIKHSHVIRGPVDLFIKQFWRHQVPLFGCQPYPFTAYDQPTTITDRQNKSPKLCDRIKRQLTKIPNWLQRARFNRNFKLKLQSSVASKTYLHKANIKVK